MSSRVGAGTDVVRFIAGCLALLIISAPGTASADSESVDAGGLGTDTAQIHAHHEHDAPGKEATGGVRWTPPPCSMWNTDGCGDGWDGANKRLVLYLELQDYLRSQAGQDRQAAQTEAVDVIKALPMPVPNPVMSAPKGIAGVKHQLNLQIPATQMFPGSDTALGHLDATAYGRFHVDWGDGTSGDYADSGATWPHSNISHVWTTSKTYKITVTAKWTVDWALGGFDGAVGDLQTTGAIQAWPVLDLQAVITR